LICVLATSKIGPEIDDIEDESSDDDEEPAPLPRDKRHEQAKQRQNYPSHRPESQNRPEVPALPWIYPSFTGGNRFKTPAVCAVGVDLVPPA